MPRLPEKTLAQRSKCAWQLRDQWRSSLQDAYELALAAHNPYDPSKRPKSQSRQFDSTAPNSVKRAANRLLMELTPPDQQWASMEVGPLLEMQYSQNPQALQNLKQMLEPMAKIIALSFASGMFINAIWEVYLDLLVAGMGALSVLENPTDYGEPAVFQSVSQSEIAIEENGRGEVAGVFRTRKKFKARMIEDIWDDAKIPPKLRELMDGKAGSPNKKDSDPEIELLECTYEGPGTDKVRWYYDVLWTESGNDPVRLVEREYETCPWIIFRWSKLPGIPYGPGPVLFSIADIRTVNVVKEMLLKNAALALAGIYLAKDDGVLNPDNVVLSPGLIIPVGSTGGAGVGASLMPLQTGRTFDLAQFVINDLQASIKKSLFDNALPPAESTVRSPTEIMQRVKELTEDIGGNIGRLTTDLVHLYRRVADIHVRKGLVPVNLKIDQLSLKVQINSPLAKAQAMNEVQTVINWLSIVSGALGPQSVMLAAVVEKLPSWIAGKMGVPTSLVRSDDDREALQSKVAQLLAVQAQAANAGQAAGAPSAQAA